MDSESLRIPSGIVSTKDGADGRRVSFFRTDISYSTGWATDVTGLQSLIFRSQLSQATTKVIAFALMYTRQRNPCIVLMTPLSRVNVSCQVDESTFRQAIKARGKKEGHYRDSLCDIVGTGGDSHSTFNDSTTSSIIASPLIMTVMTAKHGNRAQISFSGSADIRNAISPVPPQISTDAWNVAQVYKITNYSCMSAVAALKRINSNASTSGRPNAPGTRVNAQAPQRAAASVSQGNSSEIADKSLNNLGPVEMDAILLMETRPPTLTHTYNNNYQPGELLTDRFGFIYDQRRKTRQTAGPIVALTTGDDNPLRGASFGADLERFCWNFSMLYLL